MSKKKLQESQATSIDRLRRLAGIATTGESDWVGTPSMAVRRQVNAGLVEAAPAYSPELMAALQALASSSTAAALLAGKAVNAFQLKNFIAKHPSLAVYSDELSGKSPVAAYVPKPKAAKEEPTEPKVVGPPLHNSKFSAELNAALAPMAATSSTAKALLKGDKVNPFQMKKFLDKYPTLAPFKAELGAAPPAPKSSYKKSYGSYGGYKSNKETEEARQELENAIDSHGEAFYEKRKAEKAALGKGIVPYSKFRELLEKEMEEWLKDYKRVFGVLNKYDDDYDMDYGDHKMSAGERMPEMPQRLRAVAEMAGAYIPNWDVRNNMYDPRD